MANELDRELDRLFQLPLAAFTAERNALAKRVGKDGADVKALAKPPLAAWAVNQLYFKDRDSYDALVAASSELRRSHKAVLEGRKADLRSAGREHDLALETALKSTLSLAKDNGQPVTDATRQAVVNTLRALPSSDAPGRLTRVLSPGGLEMLAGITPTTPPRGSQRSSPKPSDKSKAQGSTAAAAKEDARAERDAARERERRAAAERALRDADHKLRHAEFEAARAARDAAKTSQRAEQARRALDEAQAELETADHARKAAERTRQAADKQVEDARKALDKARQAVDSR